MPSITRKTGKGLPRYRDDEDSDVFILSGAEDLVPVYTTTDGKTWVPSRGLPPQVFNGATFDVKPYRPRVEGLFARIEKWTDQTTGETHWRSVTKENVTSYYGLTPGARLSNPADPTQVFQWLLEQSQDDKGNVITYKYKPEDTAGVDLSTAFEASRTQVGSLSANLYPQLIEYGNITPGLTDKTLFLFKVVFDYGEYSPSQPQPGQEVTAWPARSDAFSTFKPGFEVRTRRLCRRVLMFHCFPNNELPLNPCLVRSTEFQYDENPVAAQLTSLTQKGYLWQGTAAAGAYQILPLPTVEFTYSEPVIDESLHFVGSDSLENLPVGIGSRYEWVDLDSEGLSGILAKQTDAWYYKPNLSALPVNQPGGGSVVEARFAPSELLGTQPSLSGAGTQLLDLSGNGHKFLVQFSKPMAGYYERGEEGRWESFTPFASQPNVPWNDPNLKMIDLNGDGFADLLLLSEDDLFLWYPSLAKEGFGKPETVRKPFDEDYGPVIIFADGTETVFLADMSGDGLTDIVRVRSGEVCYWPNLGYGRFGSKVAMDNAPVLDRPDLFDPRRIRLADIDGSGTTDILYLRGDSTVYWLNQAGNGFGDIQVLREFPPADSHSSVVTVDLLGNGTTCLVWSSPLPEDADRPMRYLDLMGGQKPYLLTSIDNHMGKVTNIQYTPSTKFYLQDQLAGKPWATKLPFPVQVVEKVTTLDQVTGTQFINCYRYHHGYYDGIEREFRGFGMVEQMDTDVFESFVGQGIFKAPASELYVPPVITKTWFHTGAYFGSQRLTDLFQKEYFSGDAQAWTPPPTQLPTGTTWMNGAALASVPGLTAHEEREACRALKGRVLRQEIYAQDDSSLSQYPYSVVDHAYTVQMFQPVVEKNRPGLELPHGVFYAYERESISYHYERVFVPSVNPQADPRIGHQMTLAVDGYGNVTDSAAVAYPRRIPDPALTEQSQTFATYNHNAYFNYPDGMDYYRIGVPLETLQYQVTGLVLCAPFTADALFSAVQPASGNSPSNAQLLLIGHGRNLYRSDDLSTVLAFGSSQPVQSMALPYQTYRMVIAKGALQTLYGTSSNPAANYSTPLNDVLAILTTPENGYVPDACTLDGSVPGNHPYNSATDNLWIPSGQVFLSPTGIPEWTYAQGHFFQPCRFQDAFGNVTNVTFDPNYSLLPIQSQDALNNKIQAQYNFRVLVPWLLTDPNGDQAGVRLDALGMVTATAVMGQAGLNQGDVLDLTTSEASPIDDPTTKLDYYLFNWDNPDPTQTPVPNYVHIQARETHHYPATTSAPVWQESYVYSDGFGRVIQTKFQAEPGLAHTVFNGTLTSVDTTPNVRWIGTGRILFDNKGNPVKKYEPFFSTTYEYEFETLLTQWGVTPILHYDPLSRLIRTDNPDGTYTQVEFDSWQQIISDANDKVLNSQWYINQGNPNPSGAQPTGSPNLRAAWLAAQDAGTPTVVDMDPLGRTIQTTLNNGKDSLGNQISIITYVQLDIQGNQLSVNDSFDPLSGTTPYLRTVMRFDYDMLKGPLHQASMEAGEKWLLGNAVGKPIRSWNSRSYRMRQVYDALNRPLQLWVSLNGGGEALTERMIYGESYQPPSSGPTAAQLHLLGRIFQIYDEAGLVTNQNLSPSSGQAYDFKGNLLGHTRQLALGYNTQIDWSSTANQLDNNKIYYFSVTYDALNRMVTQTTPDQSVSTPQYNQRNLLSSLSVLLQGLTVMPFIISISYNEKGQRLNIAYGNNAQTAYTYDPETYRLTELTTTAPIPNSTVGTLNTFQDLSYTYDPVGNIVEIDDHAQQTLYLNNSQITPNTLFQYDPIYRLTYASGREHIGQNQNLAQYDNWNDEATINLSQPGDGTQMGVYAENYVYDLAGNFKSINHQPTTPNNTNNWTRIYQCIEPSQLVQGQTSNRLSYAQVGSSNYQYEYGDQNGNITSMPHLSLMLWDYRDQLQATSSQAVNTGGTSQTTYYVYDGAGQRVRKVTVNALTAAQVQAGVQPMLLDERVYLGGYEIYLSYTGSSNGLLRETLHVMDNQQRIALVESRNNINDGSPIQLTRYQFSNNLGTACLELDGNANPISYEEYYPYGGTSYQAINSITMGDVPYTPAPKRYRYLGKERDEETGFNYHGARYYAPWLGRWISPDPIGIGDGLNQYLYSKSNPICLSDTNGCEVSSNNGVANEDSKIIPKATDEEIKIMIKTQPVPKDKSGFNPENDPHTPEYNRQVAAVIVNMLSSNRSKDSDALENYFAAQTYLSAMLRSDPDLEHSSDNLVLRDANRYFYGVLGPYTASNADTRAKRIFVKYDTFNTTNSKKEITLTGRVIAEFWEPVYNLVKEFDIDVGHEEWIRSNEDKPASAVGGGYWYQLGARLSTPESHAALERSSEAKLLTEKDLKVLEEMRTKPLWSNYLKAVESVPEPPPYARRMILW